MQKESIASTVPSGERVHIAFFGRRNAGKSSLINAITNQPLSIVSDTPGTTTDPVRKAMELLPLGPVVVIDTAGFDDEGALGDLRNERTRKVLSETDVAIVVVDATAKDTEPEEAFLSSLSERKIPFFLVINKSDLLEVDEKAHVQHTWEQILTKIRGEGSEGSEAGNKTPQSDERLFLVSAATGDGIDALKDALATATGQMAQEKKKIVSDLVHPGDHIVLVIPIDASAPKGRIILPQQLVLRELLDHHCRITCCQVEELPAAIATKPALVITDSQVFAEVAQIVPEDICLTSFSILFARYKGTLATLLDGAAVLSKLRDGDRVLISEGCTHHRQCEDIGTKKLPQWIEDYTGAKPVYTFTSGGDFPERPDDFRLIIHCGGCMLGEAEMKNRIARAAAHAVPMTNYGIAIAQMKGILQRATDPLTNS